MKEYNFVNWQFLASNADAPEESVPTLHLMSWDDAPPQGVYDYETGNDMEVAA